MWDTVPMNDHVLRFEFDEEKGVEALTYIAWRWQGVTAFYASKVLFYAEKYHINRHGRPIVADTFIAMPNGPVPTTIYEFIKGNLYQAGDPAAVTRAFRVARDPFPSVTALRDANLDVFSRSDIRCLDEAIAFCRGKGFKTLSGLTHRDRSWADAPENGPMDYAAMIDADNPHHDAVLADAMEFAAYGVL